MKLLPLIAVVTGAACSPSPNPGSTSTGSSTTSSSAGTTGGSASGGSTGGTASGGSTGGSSCASPADAGPGQAALDGSGAFAVTLAFAENGGGTACQPDLTHERLFLGAVASVALSGGCPASGAAPIGPGQFINVRIAGFDDAGTAAPVGPGQYTILYPTVAPQTNPYATVELFTLDSSGNASPVAAGGVGTLTLTPNDAGQVTGSFSTPLVLGDGGTSGQLSGTFELPYCLSN